MPTPTLSCTKTFFISPKQLWIVSYLGESATFYLINSFTPRTDLFMHQIYISIPILTLYWCIQSVHSAWPRTVGSMKAASMQRHAHTWVLHCHSEFSWKKLFFPIRKSNLLHDKNILQVPLKQFETIRNFIQIFFQSQPFSEQTLDGTICKHIAIVMEAKTKLKGKPFSSWSVKYWRFRIISTGLALNH